MRLDFEGAARIKEGAIVLADAHYNPLGRTEILPFLDAIISGKIDAPQLFLLGDISDVLIGNFKYSRERNKELIDRINLVGDRGAEVWYFEGNHDFMLEGVFDPKIKIVRKKDQPAPFVFGEQKILMLHGDFRVETRYAIYAALIRNPIALFLANFLSLNFIDDRLLRNMEKRLLNKRLNYEIKNFIPKRTEKLADLMSVSDIAIEGHFHQNCRFNAGGAVYVNLASFACEASFIRIQWSKDGAIARSEKWELN